MTEQRRLDGGGLDWPEGFERTAPADRRAYPGNFQVDRPRAFDSVVEQLEKMDAYDIEVLTAAPHTKKQPHRPYQDREPDDPGVVAYYKKDGQQFAVACDQWSNLRDNARAVALYIDAKRALERYGVATRTSEFQAQALPSGDEEAVAAAPPPHEVLDVAPDAPDAVVEAAAREKMKETHPDQGGTGEALQRVRQARQQMLEADE